MRTRAQESGCYDPTTQFVFRFIYLSNVGNDKCSLYSGHAGETARETQGLTIGIAVLLKTSRA